MATLPIFTIGHSTLPLDDFLRLLETNHVELLVDVRTMPRSRRNPQFNRESLPGELARPGIGYLHMPGLGGLRKPQRDSPNRAWRNDSFRGYADYMLTPEFERHLDELIRAAREVQTAIMCAEAVPWRCHRSLIADALTVRKAPVEHIMSSGRREAHTLRDWAKVEGLRLTYPAGTLPLEGFPSSITLL
ncbi:MAG: DUF488 domain-containing protein [Bryobacteraceae bacterium]